MKALLWKSALLAALILCISLGPAVAAMETKEESEAKFQRFLDALTAQGMPLGEVALDEGEGNFTVLTDYMAVSTQDEEGYSFTYNLSIAHAALPEGLRAEDFYAAFLHACAGEAGAYEDAAATVAWLREYMVRTSFYGLSASKAFGEYTVTLSASLTDSEENLSLTRYSDDMEETY